MTSILHLKVLRVSLGLAATIFLTAAIRGADSSVNLAPSEAPVAHWSDIKGDTYDQRAHFADGANRLLGRLDVEIAALNAKRAGMTTDTSEWDFAMKEVNNDRELLRDRITELGKQTTPDTWSPAKEQVGLAWSSSILAIDKMNSTVTS